MKSRLPLLALALLGASPYVTRAGEVSQFLQLATVDSPKPADLWSLREKAVALEHAGRGAEAVKVYVTAALHHDAKAAQRLAEIYDKGIPGVAPDPAESLKWARHAARIQSWGVETTKPEPPPPPHALLYRQALTLEREGRGADAVDLYKQSARSGSGKAALRLGEIYEKGLANMVRNTAEAHKWYNTARIFNALPHELDMRLLLEEAQALERAGKGAQAVRTYTRAARSGSGKAALRLAEIYRKGIPGVRRDHQESSKWYNMARVLGEDVPAAK